MAFIWIISGSPCSGKSTLAHTLWMDHGGVHLHSDDFFGYVAPLLPPHLPASHAQNETVARACARAAVAFAQGGYEVFLDGVIGPWFLPLYQDELQAAGVPLAYVVVHVDQATALARGVARDGADSAAMIASMHPKFAAPLGRWEGHRVDGSLPPAMLAAQLRADPQRFLLSSPAPGTLG